MREQKEYPKVYLASDNCFAYKRWTEPEEWARVISELGIKYIEASADTELDPLYMGKEYISDWTRKVKKAESKYGVKVANLYSGHGTYSTLGLTHTDRRVRERMEKEWFRPMIDIAASVDAGLGFFAHGFSETVMQDEVFYEQFERELYASLGRLCKYAADKGCRLVSVEQMYVPYMIPWTIHGTRKLLREIKRETGLDFYFTEDLGHHHTKFLRPSKEQIQEAFARRDPDIWLGSDETAGIYKAALERGSLSEKDLFDIEMQIQSNSRFFTEEEDLSCYTWLRKLGCYSPIIHLQQTNGCSSAHKPFTEAENQKGMIEGKKVLQALKESYDRESEEGMPRRCDEIYLTLELFSGTTQTTGEILKNMDESVRYWRQFIPQDGVSLAELVD